MYMSPSLANHCMFLKITFRFEYCFSDDLLKKLRDDPNYILKEGDEKILSDIHDIVNGCEYFLLSYIVVNLMTPFQNEHGLYVKDFMSIVLNYVFSWDGIWIDLLASSSTLVPQAESIPLFLLLTRVIRLVSLHLIRLLIYDLYYYEFL